MSNSKPNPNPNPNTKAPEPVMFNTAGLRPVKATFQLDIDQLKREIRRIADKEITGVQDVTFERDSATGAVRGFIWFDAKGEHFVDKSTQGTALQNRGNISRTSHEFKNFAAKYGWTPFDDDPEHGENKVPMKAVMGNNKNPEARNKLMYLQISLNPFLFAIFDMFGQGYKSQFGTGTPKFQLRREWKFRKGESGKYHNLVGLLVEKSVADAVALNGRPRASKSGRFS